MNWVQLRSRRDPAFWLPLLLSVVVLVPLGVGMHLWLAEELERLPQLWASNPETARAETIRTLRISSWSFCAVLAALCACLFRYFQLGRREGRLPPSGWWSLGAFRCVVGPTAQRMSRLGQGLCALLVACAIALGITIEHLIRTVLLSAPAA